MEKYIKNISFPLFFVCLLQLAFLHAANAAEVPTLEDIEFNSLSVSEEQIIFKLNGTYIPKIFAIKGKKPRVVFDFPNTITAQTLNNIITTNGNFIRQIRVGIHEGEQPKTRVVLDLTPNKEVDFNQKFNRKNNTLTVTVYYTGAAPAPAAEQTEKPPAVQLQKAKPLPVQEPAPLPATVSTLEPEQPQHPSPFTPPALTTTESPAPAETTPTTPETPAAEEEHLRPKTNEPPILHSVKFDDSSNRGEMIQFKLNDFYPPIVFGIEEGLPRVVCDFKNTRIESSIKKTMKTNGQYVKNIRIGQHKNPDKIRVVIDLEPNNNYDLQQVFFKEDNLFVIIVNIMHNTPPITELEKPLTH